MSLRIQRPIQRTIIYHRAQMERSENIYGNVNDGDQCQRSLDEDENIYANRETLRTQRKKGNGEIPGAGTKCYKVSVVSLGLLCVLLPIAIVWMVTKYTADTQQLQRHLDLLHSNLTGERDLFQEKNTNITKERDQLQLCNNNLIKERDLFQERNTNITKENHELRDMNKNLTAEKNDLMDKNRNLTAEKEKLLNTFPIPQGWRRFGDSFYYISNNETTWSDGKQQCMDRGGYLMIIDSKEEQEFISEFQRTGWIGLNDVEGTWKWLDGELLKTGYWKEGEPNGLNGTEHCVEIVHDATPLKNWNDTSCTERRRYFCEQPVVS